METRELFWALDSFHIVLFYIMGISAMLLFLLGIIVHIIKYRHGKPVLNKFILYDGLCRMFSDVFSQRTVRKRDKKAGWAHTGIFYGFLIAALGTAIITLDYDIIQPLFNVSFWKGDFYLWYSLILVLGHLVLTLSLIYMIMRRAMFNLSKLDYVRSYAGDNSHNKQTILWVKEDWFFIILLLTIEITGFLQEGLRILIDQPPWQAWSPVGCLVAITLKGLWVSPETATSLRFSNWWFHSFIALAFTALIPWYKAKHMVTALGSLSVRDLKPLSRLPVEVEDTETAGINSIADLTWKDMLHLDACTKCGRCHEACPARVIGNPLSPRDVILDLRVHNDECKGKPHPEKLLLNDIISSEALWSCRSCGACQEVCPVGIEHPSLIVRMRRQLVERGDMDPLLQGTLDTISNVGNSFAEPARKRSAWTEELDFKVKDIRKEPAKNLWFVGDYASFDPRNQKVSQTFARLLKQADVDFGLLHEGEHTAGNDVRRVGEEGLFESLAEHNIEQMNSCESIEQIITTDPHSYNTIKNEYSDFGNVAPIRHYTSVLVDLIKANKLKVINPLNINVTFHDPCHLGRLNGGYDAPRDLLKLIGCDIIEMPRSRENSFCCGAGGGRIWIPDQVGTEKPSENRIREAVALEKAQLFVVCCPKDLTMFEDARKTAGVEDKIEVREIAELVAEAVQIDAFNRDNLPDFVEQLTESIATRIADVVSNRLEEMLAGKTLGTVSDSVQSLTPTSGQASIVSSDVSEESVTDSREAVSEDIEPNPESLTSTEDDSSNEPIREQIALTPMNWEQLNPVTAAEFSPYDLPEKNGPRILVMVKHVAVLGDEYEFTADGCDIKNEYLEYVLNEWDDVALEEALQFVDKAEAGEVVAVTVGPPDADVTLRKVLAKGADRAVRVWDDSLIGADPVSISRALAGIARLEEPDLVLCGVQSSDFAHGSTGMSLAKILGLPHAAVVVSVDWDGSSEVNIQRELEGGTLHNSTMPTPAVISVQTGINQPRYATMRMVKQARKKPLVVVDGSHVLDGSAAYHIKRMYVPEQTKAEMMDGDAKTIAERILAIVSEHREK